MTVIIRRSIGLSRKISNVGNRLLILFALMLALGAACLLMFRDQVVAAFAPFLLQAAAPERSDLIYLLGGNYLVRAPFAAKLYREGWAPKVLVSREPSEPGRPNFTDITVRILVENGVPPEKIIQFSPGRGVRSTADEARSLKIYLDTYPARKVLVVTSMFHSARAHLAVSRALWNHPASIRVVGVEEPAWTTQSWRDTDYGRKQVSREELKLVGYWLTMY